MAVLLDAADAEALQGRVAGGLRAAGLVPGDRVLVALAPSTSVVVLALAAARTGVVPVMVHPTLLPSERAVIEEDADAHLVVDRPDAFDALLAAAPAPLPPLPLTRPMHYTSGTTGRPKGVWLGEPDEAAGRAWVEEEQALWGHRPDDVHLVCGPLHHSAPLRFAMITLLAGGAIVVPGAFLATSFAAAIEDLRVTSTFVVPAHLQRVLGPDAPGRPDGAGIDTSSLRLVAHAGAPCPELLKRRAIEALGEDVLWEFYGSTEGQFTACSSAEWLDRPGTVGRARPGRHLDVDADGVLWCTVPPHARFSYWRDPEATAAAWRDDAFSVGDAGRLDEDGYLFLEGRRGEIIITGGVNVAPLEVERALASCPGVEDVAVFGVPDERWGSRVCAAVVGTAPPEVVVAHARERLSAYKCPKDVIVLDAIPRSTMGKVRRATLAAELGLA
jgi:long-chain acyl-CoA synthetase